MSSDVETISELEESLMTSGLSQRSSQKEFEQLGAELPDLPYKEDPVSLGYENEPVVERKASGRGGIFLIITLTIAASQYLDEFQELITQFF